MPRCPSSSRSALETTRFVCGCVSIRRSNGRSSCTGGSFPTPCVHWLAHSVGAVSPDSTWCPTGSSGNLSGMARTMEHEPIQVDVDDDDDGRRARIRGVLDVFSSPVLAARALAGL